MIARRLRALAAVGLAGYLATGLTAIPRDEVGIVRRFGAALREPWSPGLHWGLPWGIDRVDRVAVNPVRTIDVGGHGPRNDFLTGDLNLVAVDAKVEFQVVRPVDFLFGSSSADSSLAALAESSLVRAFASRSVDDLLNEGRAEAADRMKREIQSGADAHNLGVSIRSVRLARVAPPSPLAPDFADAARAKGELTETVARAEAYRDRAKADTRALSRESADRAAARADSLVQSAKGDAERFNALVRAIQRNPLAARQRMYLDALAELLPRFARKVVVAPSQELDLSVIAD